MIGLRRSTLLCLLAAASVFLGSELALVSSAGAQMAGPIDCPPIKPTSELQKGMIGTGWTVVEGRTPQPFQALVKGVLPNGFGPGRDLIVVELSGATIDTVGGAWYGMSGSPVYVDGELIVAVSAVLAYGPSKIVGLTAAEDMHRLFSYPSTDASTDPSSSLYPAEEPANEPVPTSLRLTDRDINALGARSTDQEETGSSFVQMKIPLSVSGMSDRAFTKFRRIMNRENAPFVPYAGSSAAAQESTTPAQLHAGGNFAGVISYGDLTLAGIGTTTMVCEGAAIAYGHPFFWEGKTQLGANDANSLVIVKDEAYGSYKLAVVAEAAGTIDQDRLAGVRAITGAAPPSIPITSTVNALNTGNARDGQTDAVLSEMVPFLAPYHLYANILVTFDQWGAGSSDVSWTIRGTTESGQPFELTRSNMYASEWGIEYHSVIELEGQLYQLFYNDFEEITFDSVDADVTIDDEIRRYSITKVLVARNGRPYEETRRIRAARGDTIRLQVTLTPYDLSGDRVVEMTVRVPRRARTDGILEISGGSGPRGEFCFYEPRACDDGSSGKIESLDQLIARLENAPHNNELRAVLRMGQGSRVATDMEVLDQVVTRTKRIRVRLIGGSGCCAPKPTQEEPRSGH